MMRVAELRIYPIKSCRGVSLISAMLQPRGFADDRRAMIVAQDGRFLTQRTHPKLAQISVDVSDGYRLAFDGASFKARFEARRLTVAVWRDVVSARVACEAVNEALSVFLGEPVFLVAMDDQSHRTTDAAFGGANPVSFADGFPYLITTTASLDALRQSVGEAVPMDRFRPNIVIETDTPWLEDTWRELDIGGHVFEIVKPCTRCVVTTLDQSTGDQVGQSTMQALIETRARSGDWGRGVIFGVNAIARHASGPIRQGMPVVSLDSGQL